jgi:hypothetical protein
VNIHDYGYAFRGHWDAVPQGRCRVRIRLNRGSPPVLILTELQLNPTSSIASVIEYVVPELVAKHFPHRFDALGEPSAIVVEHCEARDDPRHGGRAASTVDLVTFGSWLPRRVRTSSRQDRVKLGDPVRHRMDAAEVRALLGTEASDLMGLSRVPSGHT